MRGRLAELGWREYVAADRPVPPKELLRWSPPCLRALRSLLRMSWVGRPRRATPAPTRPRRSMARSPRLRGERRLAAQRAFFDQIHSDDGLLAADAEEG